MQNTKNNVWIWVVVIIVIVGLGWWLMARRADTGDNMATTTPATTTGAVATGTVSLEDDMIDAIIVTYGAEGFSPATVTINKGQTVRWVNQSNGDMWVATAMHPTHTVYPGSDIKKCDTGADIFDQCENGDTYEFMFDEIGEWGYHNHSQAGKFGKVIVQ